MRRVVHRLLTGFPALGVATLALLAAANPAGAMVRLNGFVELMSDARFFWLCVAILAGYFVLWWITSIEPKSRRRYIQAGLRPHFETLTRMVHQFKRANTYDEVQALIPAMDAALTATGNWLLANMAPAAFEKFKTPPTGTTVWSFPAQTSAAAEHRSNIVVLNEARLQVLDTFLRHDGWDGEEPSAWERIKRWKNRKTASTNS